MELKDYIQQLLSEGYHCSQVMMKLSQAMRGQENEPMIRALGGLAGGMFMRQNCGCLTGGACVLASYVDRAEGEVEPTEYQDMVRELVTWFEQENGSLQCRDLVSEDMVEVMNYCPGLMERTYQKVLDILQSHGIDPYQ